MVADVPATDPAEQQHGMCQLNPRSPRTALAAPTDAWQELGDILPAWVPHLLSRAGTRPS
jgi:hypothetical protein